MNTTGECTTIWTRYVLTYDDTGDEVVVDVSDTPETAAILQEINSFWSGAEWRLDDADGNLVHAVLTMLCTTALWHSVTHMSALDTLRKGEVEGWPALDGSHGIQLVSVGQMSLLGDVTIKSQPVPPRAAASEEAVNG